MSNIAITELESESTQLKDNDYILVSNDNGNGSYTSMKMKGSSLRSSILELSSYSLTVASTSGGTVDPISTKVVSGAACIVTAKPNTGYIFEKWSGDSASSVNPLTINITKNTNLTAHFKLETEKMTFTDSTVSINSNNFIFDNTAHVPSFKYNNEISLQENVDYTITYSNNINAGTCVCTLIGIDRFTGTIQKSFVIQPFELTESNTLFTPDNFNYDGTAKNPGLTLNDGTGLIKDTDYSITFTDNINAGTATGSITGSGNYTGSFTKHFIIVETEQCSAGLARIENVVTCTATKPTSGATIYYATSNGGSWNVGSKVTVSFTKDETKYVYFKVIANGYNDLGSNYKFGYSVTRTSSTETSYGSWNSVYGTNYNSVVDALSIWAGKGYEIEYQGYFSGYYYGRYRSKTTYTNYSYSGTKITS